MKRFFSAFLVFLCVILLSSCSREPPPLNENISATVAVSKNDEVLGSCTVSSNGSIICISLLSPENAAGISYTYENEKLTVAYHELQCITDSDYLPDDSEISVLYDGLRSIKGAQYTESKDGADRYSAQTEHDCFLITAEDGIITAMQSENHHLLYTFT